MTTKDIKLSILDLATIHPGQTAIDALNESKEIAILADQLGYERYWFAEHHNIKSQISTSPDILSSHIGAVTKRIRVGAGGIMLPNYSALKVAENFAMLEALVPGRIDLGIGRAPGTDRLTAYALRRTEKPESIHDFPQQMDELLAFLTHEFPSDHPYGRITPTADPTLVPNMYMLGSSTGGVQVAIEKGLGFAFAAQINPQYAIPVMKMYYEQFKPSQFLEKPYGILSIIVIVADTEEEAHYLAQPAILQWVQLATGKYNRISSLEEANNYVYNEREKAIIQMNREKFIIGNIEQVTRQIIQLVEQTGADELMIFDMYPNKESRIDAYKLLAKAFNL